MVGVADAIEASAARMREEPGADVEASTVVRVPIVVGVGGVSTLDSDQDVEADSVDGDELDGSGAAALGRFCADEACELWEGEDDACAAVGSEADDCFYGVAGVRG